MISREDDVLFCLQHRGLIYHRREVSARKAKYKYTYCTLYGNSGAPAWIIRLTINRDTHYSLTQSETSQSKCGKYVNHLLFSIAATGLALSSAHQGLVFFLGILLLQLSLHDSSRTEFLSSFLSFLFGDGLPKLSELFFFCSQLFMPNSSLVVFRVYFGLLFDSAISKAIGPPGAPLDWIVTDLRVSPRSLFGIWGMVPL